MAKTGNLSINSENMLPIIKKWLYSDHDIFVREQVANACDAITKLKKLEGIGKYTRPEGQEYQVQVVVNPDEKTLKFIDNGIGMTEEEVVEYITQIAFSGAEKFLEQYKDEQDAAQIIGHFGLGFYSAFMVADEVHIDTLSYLPDAAPVHWESDGQSEYSIEEGSRSEVGTEITLFLTDDALEFCNEYRIREILNKYCSFMPTAIYLTDAGSAAVKRREEEVEKGEQKDPEPINDTNPLWTRMPADCTDEDYKAFYRKVFNDYKEPLFWIHLKTDYPFNLRGILYFPKINTEYDALDAQIRLYNNQVFIADNIKEVIPEFLMTLKGVIDCPDLPLNVSRSALQNDGTVRKIAEYISRKMADRLSGMCKTDRENYEKCWDDISPFVKYGCIRDTKFADRMMDYMLFKDLEGKYLTLKEYEEANGISAPEKAEAKDESGEAVEAEVVTDGAEKEEEAAKTPIFYVTDEVQQAQYIGMFRKNGKDAVILKENIDQPYIQQLEMRNEHIRFARIDSELAGEMRGEEEVSEADTESLTATFRKHLNNEALHVQVTNMKDPDVAAIVTLSEESRRMNDMMRMYGMSDMGGGEETLVLNASHPLVQFVLAHRRSQSVPVICAQLYDLARISQHPLSQEEMTAFMKRSNEIMLLLTK